MEQLNLVTLRGIIGSVRVQDIQERKVANFTVATNFAFKGRDGEAIIETTWHSCIAFEGGHVSGIDRIVKGTAVHLTGRIRCYRFIDVNNTERTGNEIVVNTLEVL